MKNKNETEYVQQNNRIYSSHNQQNAFKNQNLNQEIVYNLTLRNIFSQNFQNIFIRVDNDICTCRFFQNVH